MTKREFLTSGIGAGFALSKGTTAFSLQSSVPPRRDVGQSKRPVPSRMAKTTKLFKSPQGFPNAIVVTSEGLWIGEQKMSGAEAAAYHLPEPTSFTEDAWLVD